MDFKKSTAARTTQTRDFRDLEMQTDNIYESIVAAAERSKQISGDMKEELLRKIDEFKTNNESLEEIFENNEQIEVSKYYERLPKAVLIALDEMTEDQLEIYREKED